MKKKPVNSMEVAKKAGVSQSTVSRVFTPGSSVSPKTRKRVLEAARELGYRPNALARGLIMNKTNIIGLAMRDIQNPFYPEILEKFTKALRDNGYHVLFVHTENDEINQDEISEFLEYNVEGVIVTDATLSPNIIASLSSNGIPVILFNRRMDGLPCHSVSCDNYTAGKKIGEYLYELGYRRMAYIRGRKNTSTNDDRERGFCEALMGRGAELCIEDGEFTYEGGYNAALRLLGKRERPEVIFGANDITALGVMDAARAIGLSIPDDVAVIGFDDITMASWPSYGLTTWRQPVDEMIEWTLAKLFVEIDGGDGKPSSILFPGILVERGSVKKRS
ncbi:LacI family transcriptional regulator [Geobacillus subterraneus]|uniref:LacI family transcriptional regulator n=2 Tax=Geobacillus TaxID=129337 RepID=A0ABN4NP74_9BACL|nr:MULTISPECIES: LacI family DNA-binding transcriptional regulator [Geobacillus]AMX84756.1 LacI family transcriptional regulator [Geobacillus subterraneus]KZS25416.1 LacI family transcriptional regulator [Geobacillus subterraneus]OXB85711.1 LacI family transcriptional regulator [Geobacillus uzenensis]